MTEAMIKVNEKNETYILALNIPHIRIKAQQKKYIDFWVNENIKYDAQWEYTDFNPYSVSCEIEHQKSFKGTFTLHTNVPNSEKDIPLYLDVWISSHFNNTHGWTADYPCPY